MADRRIDLLRRVPLFSACNDRQLEFIATQVEEMEFATGRDLCRQGEAGGDFFVIVSGTAEVTQDGARIRALGPGEFFGEIALIDHGPRTATVTATMPMRCLVLGPSQFQNVLHQRGEIATAVLAALGQRVRKVGAATSD